MTPHILTALVALLGAARLGAAARGVIAWGGPQYGDYIVSMKIPPEANSGVWAVTGGSYHSMAIYGPERRVIEWPPVSEKPFWPGTTRANDTYRDQPPGLTNVTAIAGGQYHSLALQRNGKVVMWTRELTGDNKTDDLPDFIKRANVRAISAAKSGGTFSLFLLANGSVFEWPPRNYSEPSYPGANYTKYIVPRPDGLLLSGRVKAIAAGYDHCLALLRNGTVIAWGGRRGQTQATVSAQFRSVRVPPAAQANVTAIAAGLALSMALLNNGSIVVWGSLFAAPDSSYGGCGSAGCNSPPPPKPPPRPPAPARSPPTPPPLLSGVRAISAAANVAVVLLPGGRVFAWGPTYFGLYLHVIPTEAQSGVVGIGTGATWWLAIK
ncbi:hypothetical protein HYH03_013739 [Edaphochlamys debaryana]|uniref:Uncharacterized protein n=1 Tax=Edaphochlamys debaryana TaxID=47281 RepID=A0A835XPN8_9CHLO|nr:hypothetical protein HYH03_013739 [Edaphochlamys debaryana]|eukprot:KAG2487741.1 hypothetical protein HYH03_013739 [Edaphochlamys debaryana]